MSSWGGEVIGSETLLEGKHTLRLQYNDYGPAAAALIANFAAMGETIQGVVNSSSQVVMNNIVTDIMMEARKRISEDSDGKAVITGFEISDWGQDNKDAGIE